MNALRLSDLMSMTAPPTAPISGIPGAGERRAQAIAGTGAASDTDLRDAAQRKSEPRLGRALRAEAARDTEASAGSDKAARSAHRFEPNLANRIGYLEGSTAMFVDLVDYRTQRELLRIFGPTQPPRPDRAAPESAALAYRDAEAVWPAPRETAMA
jgi:hypothetical protein